MSWLQSAKNRKHILLLIPELGYGGAEGDLLRLAAYLNREFRVTLLVFRSNYREKSYSRHRPNDDQALQIVEIDSQITSTFRFFRWIERLLLVKKYRVDCALTLSFLGGANLLNVLTGSINSLAIVSVRGSRFLDSNINLFEKLLWGYIIDPIVYNLADAVIPASTALANEVIKNPLVFRKNRVLPIPGSIDLDSLMRAKYDQTHRFEQEAEKLKKNGHLILMSCGRLSKEKGFDFLIEQYSISKRRIPSLKLIIIGDGPALDSLLASCASLNLSVGYCSEDVYQRDIVFLGFVKDPIRLLRCANLLAFTSRTEGLPNALLEGIAAGVKILATNCRYGPSEIHGNLVQDLNYDDSLSSINASEIMRILPAIEDVEASSTWARELSNRENYIKRRKISEREICHLLTRYDINNTGVIWSRMINTLRSRV
jgi:glycosyltransferase involved in cell wall biosynthesis